MTLELRKERRLRFNDPISFHLIVEIQDNREELKFNSFYVKYMNTLVHTLLLS